MEHSMRAQDAPADAYDGMNITESFSAATSKIGEHYAERTHTAEVFAESRVGDQEILVEPASLQIAGGGNGDVSAIHGEISLERFNGLGQIDVDENRDASLGSGFDGFGEKYESGPSAENIDQSEGFPEMAEFGGENGNSDVPQVGVEFNVAKPDFEQHITLSGNVENQNPPLPEQLQGQAVKADQNGTLVGEQPPKTPVAANDSVSKEAEVAEARDTSSIPGISMLAEKPIPPAVFKQEEVIANKEVFAEALNKFHTFLGTRLTKKGRGGRERAAEVKTFEESIAGIPKLGGNDLDLHVLYKEVTSRGGLEQVIKDRKWKEVTNCFKEAETTTSASYILRKYYVGLLYYFEQSYLHGKTGPRIPPPISMPGPSPLSVKRSASGLGIALAPTEGQPGFKKTRKRKILGTQTMPVMDPAQHIGLPVRSTIEGKFEHGYLVSVTVGTEKLRGIIYHVPPMQRAPQHATIPNYEATIGAEHIVHREEPSLRGIKRKRRRADDMPKKDPNAPRPNRTGYNFFFAEQRARLKALHPEKDKELSRMIGDAWNSLTEEEKAPYQDRGVQDKERYKIELRQYLELLKSHNGNIPTELAISEHDVEDAKEKLEEAVVDAAIDVAVDVAVNNAVDVSVDDVVDVTTKAVTDATVGSHHTLPAAAASDVAAAVDTPGNVAVTEAPGVSPVVDATNGTYNPIAAVDVDNGTPANTVTVATVGPNTTMDVDDGIPNAVNDAPDGSANLLASMDVDIGPQQPDSVPQQPESVPQQPDYLPHQPEISQQPW